MDHSKKWIALLAGLAVLLVSGGKPRKFYLSSVDIDGIRATPARPLEPRRF